jgi:hypothetical protein
MDSHLDRFHLKAILLKDKLHLTNKDKSLPHINRDKFLLTNKVRFLLKDTHLMDSLLPKVIHHNNKVRHLLTARLLPKDKPHPKVTHLMILTTPILNTNKVKLLLLKDIHLTILTSHPNINKLLLLKDKPHLMTPISILNNHLLNLLNNNKIILPQHHHHNNINRLSMMNTPILFIY